MVNPVLLLKPNFIFLLPDYPASKYQSKIAGAKKSEISRPATRNGPKGIGDDIVFFFADTITNPIIAPKRFAKNTASNTGQNPSAKPIKNASFTSPNPIHFPRDARNIAKNKPPANAAPENGSASAAKSIRPKRKKSCANAPARNAKTAIKPAINAPSGIKHQRQSATNTTAIAAKKIHHADNSKSGKKEKWPANTAG